MNNDNTAKAPPLGASVLREYLRREGLSSRAFAELCGVPARSILNWASGTGRPRIPSAYVLQEVTDGFVRVEHWR